MNHIDHVFKGLPPASSIQLPPELLTAIFSELRPNSELGERSHVVARLDSEDCRTHGKEVLRNVSLTCWSFHDIALLIRFRHVELHAQGGTISKATEPFTRLAASQGLRNLVKVVSLTVYWDLPESAEAILCGMPNLNAIEMTHPFRMTQPLYNHICSLHSLHRLEVTIPHLCPPGNNTVVAVDRYPTMLHSVVVDYGRRSIRYRMDRSCKGTPSRPWAGLPPWLTFLVLSPSVRDLRLPLSMIPLPFTGFASQPIIALSPHLMTLNIRRPETMSAWAELWQFFELSPLITTLILSDEDYDEDEPVTIGPPLPSNLLPVLQHFEGDLRLAELVVPGRPVNAVVLTSIFNDGRPNPLRPLTFSTAIIRSLIIHEPISLELVSVIVRLFPNLEELRVCKSKYVEEDTQKWLRKSLALDIGRLKRLRNLCIDLGPEVTVDQEKDALSRLPDDHSLENVAFGSSWSWRNYSGLWTRFEAKS